MSTSELCLAVSLAAFQALCHSKAFQAAKKAEPSSSQYAIKCAVNTIVFSFVASIQEGQVASDERIEQSIEAT